ncbi:MAG: tetratricopeptide repeat protein, partial [Candidatus Kaiserbacteria bacterium]|nr:tetratricopeptide repeat protein [Candidatus Kaiserbacteria bacterium]
LSVFAATLWAIWRKGFTIAERSILTGLLVAYFCHNFFVFDNITSYILFGTILAYVIVRSSEALESRRLVAARELKSAMLPYAAFAAAIVVWGTAWGVNAHALAANRVLLSGLAPQSSILTNLQYFKDAIAYGTYGTQEAREQLAQAATQVANLSGATTDEKQQFFQSATSELKAQSAASPLDARFPLFLGMLYDAYGDYGDAAVALQKAHDLSPQKQSIYFELGQNAQARGDLQAALGYYKAALDLEPEYGDARLYYAAALIRAGKESDADQVLAPLIAKGDAADPRILSAYVSKKEYLKAAPLWKAYIAVNSTDAQAYFTLAAIYYEGGDRADAVAALQAAEAAIPEVASQADPLIQQIKNGTVKIQ